MKNQGDASSWKRQHQAWQMTRGFPHTVQQILDTFSLYLYNYRNSEFPHQSKAIFNLILKLQFVNCSGDAYNLSIYRQKQEALTLKASWACPKDRNKWVK